MISCGGSIIFLLLLCKWKKGRFVGNWDGDWNLECRFDVLV